LIVGSKEIGLELNADKPKYMVMSWDQNAGRSHSMKFDSISFEIVEEFRFFRTNQNSIKEVVKSRLASGNACFHSVQNLLSSR
jgi:hypothetical protein